MENSSSDNPMSLTHVPNERLAVNIPQNEQTQGFKSDSNKSADNPTSNNGVYIVPVYPIGPTIHSYANQIPEKDTTAYSNGINGKNKKHEHSHHDYNPHEHYFGKNQTTYLDTVVHYLKVGLGAGVLAMPNAFQNAGWLLGTILTFVIGFLCTYTVHILISSEYELCRRRKVPSMTLAETVESALEEGPCGLRWLAPHGKFLTDLFLGVYQIGSSAIYVVFIASNFKQVYDTYSGNDINIRLMMVYILIPLILICWVRNLKLLAPFSTVADATVLLSFLLIFMYVFEDVPSLSEREPIGSIQNIPLFFGTVMFAMEAIGVIMPLKNTMKEPQRFGGIFGVINASMLPIMLLYTLLGFFGYLKYGSATEGSITLNLPKDEVLANAVKIMHSASIYISYSLSNYIIFDIVWTNGIKMKYTDINNKVVWEYVVRNAICLLTFVMAIAIPNLELFISLTGSFCLSVLAIAVPAIVNTCTHWYNRGNTLQFVIILFRNGVLLLIAIFAFVVGVSSAFVQYFDDKH